MKIIKLVLASAVLFVATGIQPAQAQATLGTATVSANVSGNFNGGSVNGQFNLGSSVPTWDNITSATVSFNFYGNWNPVNQGTSYSAWTTPIEYYKTAWDRYRYSTRDAYSYYFSPTQTATVSVGDQAASNNATAWWDSGMQYTGQTYNGTYSYDESCGWWCTLHLHNDYYTNNYRENYGYYGSFNTSFGLDSSNLLSLNSTRMLDFNVAFGNSVYLYPATLTVTYAPVPEPETYAMLLAGLGLLGVAGRRRNGVSRQAA